MSGTIPEGIPESLKLQYQDMHKLRATMEALKKNQSLRGYAKLDERIAKRATTHQTWRQMKGMQLFMHEMNHPGNKPFVIGLGISCAMFLYAYAGASDQAKLESKYWQRFHAKKDGH